MSNAALLDILSNGNDPPKIQPHLGSVFDGIGSLEFSALDESIEPSPTPENNEDPSLAESRKRYFGDETYFENFALGSSSGSLRSLRQR